ncbi:MAG TPA: phosphodiester glycosidase family protein [Gammaproteobacteria bacterium]|nr:phosphodiester glycosidase family protein [Gammaproteobacteria bacterium]
MISTIFSARKLRSFLLIITLLSSIAISEESFHLIEKKELPNQLGTFREIEFNHDQTATIYTALLNPEYHARFYQDESKIQFFASYLDELNRHHDFTIGINGGFYQPNFTPVGLFIYQGKMIKPLVHNSLLKACIIINKNQKIILETDLDQCLHADNAMQTGPLLIQNGKINPHLQHLQTKSKSMQEFFDLHKRTLLAFTDENQIVMIVTSPISLMDLANFLQNHPHALGTKKIMTAINLDGGSSTGMYVRFPSEAFYFHELKHVKTFIFVN